jgi:hypothetical protein
MKAKSKWLAIFLVLGLILAACGGDGGGSDETTTTDGSTDTTEDMTTTTEGDMTSTTAGGGGDIATDVGVDLEAGTITVGLLSDLSGVFSSLVQVIVTGQESDRCDPQIPTLETTGTNGYSRTRLSRAG